MLKVLLVEDSPEVQRRLLDMLAVVPDVEVVGCAATVERALWMAGRSCPDVVMLDVALRDGDRGYDVLTALVRLCPQCRVVVLSNFGWGAMRDAFLRAGACAYFDKAFEFAKARDWICEAAMRYGERAGAGAAAADPGPAGTRAAPGI